MRYDGNTLRSLLFAGWAGGAAIGGILLVLLSPADAAYETLTPPPTSGEGAEATLPPPAIGDIVIDFPAPPGPAFTAGVLMQLRGDAWVLYSDDVVGVCGREGGCVRFTPDGTFCTMVIDFSLAPLAAGVIERHLLARCAGWAP